MIVLIGCGEFSDTPDEPPTEAGAAPTETGIQAPPPTPTPEALTENEELDQSDFYDSSLTFAELTGLNPPGSIKPVFLHTITKGLFEVAVPRSGPFTISGKASGDEQYYRLDLRIENIGDESGIFEPEGMLLTDDQGNEFDLHWDASTRVLNWPFLIAPDSVERGYVLFDPLPDAVRNIRITFNLGADDFQYDLDLKAG